MRFVFEDGKRPGEVIPFSIDFAKDLQKITGDTIQSLVVSAKKKSDGSDASSMIVDSSFVGTVCWATVQGGQDGSNYLVNFKVTTVMASPKGYEHDIEVPVRSDA